MMGIFRKIIGHFWLLSITLSFVTIECGNSPQNKPTPHDSLTAAEFGMLEPGDLILRRSKGVGGLMIAKRLNEAIPVTHVGIVARLENKWAILQSVGGGVAKVVRYGVHYVTPEQFFEFSKESTLVVSRLKESPEIRKWVVERAWKYYHEKLPFDYDYDLDNHEAIFCTELVYLAVSEAVGRDFFHRNKVGKEYEYIPFNEFLNTNNFDIILSHHPGNLDKKAAK